MEDNYSESGIDWGFEVESITLEIIGDADEIHLEVLLDLLLQRKELQTLFAKTVEFIQELPLLAKKYGKSNSYNKWTIRKELQELIYDLTSGNYHIYQNAAHQKLKRNVKIIGNEEQVFILRIGNDNNYI